MIRALISLCSGLLGCVIIVSPAAARDFIGYATTEPILYRYAACVFEDDAPTEETQIEKCAPLKAELAVEAEGAIDRFHVLERYDVERELREGFREIERDIKQTRKRNKPVPPAIVGYLRCMGEGAMAKTDYQTGDAVDYIGVADSCEADHIKPSEGSASSADANSIRALYLRFQRRGRLTFPAARQGLRRSRAGSRLVPVRVYDRSFLNIGLIRRGSND